MKRQNVRTLLLIVCTFLYLLLGAAIFDALESKNEEREKARLEDIETTIQMRYNISDGDMEKLRDTTIELLPQKAGVQWKFAGSFFFCMTVITTIGYGHSTPRTNGGKVFCMIYSLIGIPLNLVMFQSVGERLNIFMGFGIKNLKRLMRFKKAEVSHTELVMIGGLTTGFITITGSLAFQKFEGWGFLDAYYFITITLTTIGFGDLVVLQKNNHLQKSPQYVFFSIMYILGALVVVASVMNLLVLRLLTLNTEDEKREQQEQAMRQSAIELNHIDSHIAFQSNHNTSSGPLLGSKETKNRGALYDPFTLNSSNLHANSLHLSLYRQTIYDTQYHDLDYTLEQFRNSERSGKRRSV
ncbi:Potassium channel subfamily K member 3 [Holothuria leucospilota]|uniref:Potassium channel subfamily K member 3 n=1 Tax=Holothuria leucospilota TaxID=206669 RepID=A0A9Q1BCD1_HOLLE|nr:Potassium channel subfamily K member 3 [Holothuria leucospilota]